MPCAGSSFPIPVDFSAVVTQHLDFQRQHIMQLSPVLLNSGLYSSLILFISLHTLGNLFAKLGKFVSTKRSHSMPQHDYSNSTPTLCRTPYRCFKFLSHYFIFYLQFLSLQSTEIQFRATGSHVIIPFSEWWDQWIRTIFSCISIPMLFLFKNSSL